MPYWLTIGLNFLITIPAVTALVRFKKIHPKYYLFIYLIWTGVVNECISRYCVSHTGTNVINSNIYCLIEALAIIGIYYQWNLFGEKRNLFVVLIISVAAFWFIDVLFIESLRVFISYFIISYSFLVTILSIAFLNRLLVFEKKSLFKNPEFIICLCFIVFYTLNVITEVSFLYGDRLSRSFSMSVHNIFTITNLLVNIFFTYAIICMPRKIRFTMQY